VNDERSRMTEEVARTSVPEEEEEPQGTGPKAGESFMGESPGESAASAAGNGERRAVPIGPGTAIVPEAGAATARPSSAPVAEEAPGHDDAGLDRIWGEFAQYRRRLEELQIGFIDEPRETVERTGSLVEEAIDRLMNGLHSRMRQIHDQAGQSDDTESYRQAMRRYREMLGLFGVQD